MFSILYVSITESLSVFIPLLCITYFLQLEFIVLHPPLRNLRFHMVCELNHTLVTRNPISKDRGFPDTVWSTHLPPCEMIVVFQLSNLKQLCPGTGNPFPLTAPEPWENS